MCLNCHNQLVPYHMVAYDMQPFMDNIMDKLIDNFVPLWSKMYNGCAKNSQNSKNHIMLD